MVDSLNGNTTDVTAAVSSLFGEPAASQFMTLWADHLDLLGTYAADVGANDPNRRQAVQDDLHDWQQRFATFIDTATGSRVPAPDLAAALLGLDDLLLQQVDAFAARDPDKAVEVCARDKAVDDFYNSIFRTLLTHMMENPHTITQAAHLLFVAKNIERIGDHATNVAEMVYFAAKGTHMAERDRHSTGGDA